MTRKSDGYSRRSVLERAGVAALGVATVGAGTASADRSKVVSKADAREFAERKVARVAERSRFSSWRGATVGDPATYHARNAERGPDYVPSAYVFPVTNAGEDVGYVTASARSDWAPILEYSKATPPTRRVERARSTADDLGASATGRLLYHGGVQYGLELDDGRAMNVRNGRLRAVTSGIEPSGMSFASETVERDPDEVGTEDVTASDWWDVIFDVPAWTEHDGGGDGTTSYGPGDDSWNGWDGCVPVAASMIIAYHEGYDESDTWMREYLIDRLHDDMNTNDAGSTWPIDIDDGFDSFAEGSHDYSGRNIYFWSHPDFTKKEITDNQRPFLLNMTGGGSADDRDQSYGNHTVTVVGYWNDGEELEIHDTWDDEFHHLTWGSWTAASYTKVTTS